jgi:hypothetical protein
MSHLVAEITGEYHGYSHKAPEPRPIEVSRFLHFYQRLPLWYQKLDTSLGYAQVVNIYYEQVISQGPAWLCAQLGLTWNAGMTCQICEPSPYDHRSWITNWSELEAVYRDCEAQHNSGTDVNDWLSTDQARADSIRQLLRRG